MKSFNEFRDDQIEVLWEYYIETLSEEEKVELEEGIKKWGIRSVLRQAGKVLNHPLARAYYAGDAAYSTANSIKNKEPWWQTASKAMTGYWAKKHGGIRRAITGEVGQFLLPGNKDYEIEK
mgnify:CR=1 FL=1|tara:strand:- start:1473 stop:1835 length:363 start_codon:yes stop_codon:yes gene_type:complete